MSLGHSYTDKEFDKLCFEFGVKLDDITSEREEAIKSSTSKLSPSQIAKLSDTVIYKIDLPANWYNLLCIEGLSRAIWKEKRLPFSILQLVSRLFLFVEVVLWPSFAECSDEILVDLYITPYSFTFND